MFIQHKKETVRFRFCITNVIDRETVCKSFSKHTSQDLLARSAITFVWLMSEIKRTILERELIYLHEATCMSNNKNGEMKMRYNIHLIRMSILRCIPHMKFSHWGNKFQMMLLLSTYFLKEWHTTMIYKNDIFLSTFSKSIVYISKIK